MRKQNARTPGRSRSQRHDEGNAYASARKVAFAPALEHGNQSNQEQDNGSYA